jgi:hypothetical protein
VGTLVSLAVGVRQGAPIYTRLLAFGNARAGNLSACQTNAISYQVGVK